jgi:predicted transcriptional regulator|tara:strand:+ start:1629 stop:1991 length:363 start_codon:yes stop_codon:yes gene_type:complete
MVTRKRYNNIVSTRADLIRVGISLMNGLLHLSQQQLDILVMGIDLSNGDKVFTKVDRSLILSRLDISRPNLNNYIKSLKDKGLIEKNGDGYLLDSRLPLTGGLVDSLELTFNVEIEGEQG